MPRIDPNMITHRLNIDPNHHPNKQKRRIFILERYKAIKVEVDKLIKAGFIRSIDYPMWLSNMVLVRKANRQEWVYVDFTNLNNAYPNDFFPLPKINQLVVAIVGHQLLSFMDVYPSYNQIKIHQSYQEHTLFITNRGLYCYTVIPFGPKNARTMY